MVPAIILVGVLKRPDHAPSGGAAGTGDVMVRLTGEAAIALVVGFFGPYGSVGLAVGLRLSPAEMTILGTMVLIAHSLITETAIAAAGGGQRSDSIGCLFAAALLCVCCWGNCYKGAGDMNWGVVLSDSCIAGSASCALLF